MKHTITLVALALSSALALAACGDSAESDTADSAPTTATTTVTTTKTDQTTSDDADHGAGHGHNHPDDGGAPPAGIKEADNPTYPVGTEVILTANHMPGMNGALATISGAFDTTTYSISYKPTDGGEPISDHRWVVHEELVDPGQAPLADGTEVIVDAEHMPGMMGAEAIIDYSTQETVYMVDLETEEMMMSNHKWVTESEIKPAE